MALAPLDVWARVLWEIRCRVPVRFWPRLAFALFASAIETAITLPERVLLAPVWRWAFARRAKGGKPLKVVFVLGYYRSGTTHLHYLFCCDRRLATPRWYQGLIPHGFLASWGLARYFLVPFLASSRPQDDVAYGPEWPTEDDFALCNWGLASSLPGRMALPREADRFARWHDLRGLSERELNRWRRLQWAFVWKVRLASRLLRRVRGDSGPEAVLLKTPSHTARVLELVNLFGAENVRFVHLSREPAAVLRSNIAMHERFGPFRLQEEPEGKAGDIRARIVEEYDRTEKLFLEQSAGAPAGSLVRIRFADLIADPLGELRRVYAAWGVPFTDDLERRAAAYLESVREYRTAGEKADKAKREPASTPPELAWMLDAFGHTAPAKPRVEPPRTSTAGPPPLALSMLTAAVGALGAWLTASLLLRDRLDFFVWPAGVWIGLSVAACGRPANTAAARTRGVLAAMLTLLILLAAAFPTTWWAFYTPPIRPERMGPPTTSDVLRSARDGLLAWNNALWVFLGLASAYRFAARTQPRPPGE